MFGLLLTRSLAGTSRTRMLLVALLIAVPAGALDEWHQQFIPGRSAELNDWYADAAGAIAGSMLAMASLRQEFRS